MNQTDLDRRYQEYSNLCFLEGILPVGFVTWIEWDRDVYQPHVKTAATPLSPAIYQKMYGNKTMDEHNKKDNLSLIITYQERVALLEEQLRVTEAELKLTQQERENYYYRFLGSNRQLRSEKAAHQDTLSKLTALEHAVKDVGEALAAKDKEISRLKRIIKARNRPSLESYSNSCRKDKFAASFKCLPKDVCVGDILADCHSELKVTQVIEEDNVFHIHFGEDFEVFSSTEFVLLHELTSDGVPYGNLVDKTALEEAKKLITRLTEDRDEQERRLSHYRELYDCLGEAGFTIEQVITHLTSDLVTIPENTASYPHYFKALPKNVTHVDVYWVLQAWNVVNPAVQHAVKKLLCTGNRGVKDKTTDLEEARDSLNRAIELEKM